ncbi:hypothetical protein SK128_012528, partial [Halocaridina rubra]
MHGLHLIVLTVMFDFTVTRISGHTHHLHNANKEREADGSRSPRDHGHYSNGQHNAEFDHEAIL